MSGKSRIKWPDDTRERIEVMWNAGLPLCQIAASFDVSAYALRHKAISLGIYEPRKNKRFTNEQKAYMAQAWADHVPLEEIARNVGHSFGVVRQHLFHKLTDEQKQFRNPRLTRLVKRVGAEVVNAGSTPDEAVTNFKAAEARAREVTLLEAHRARQAREIAIILDMHRRIASGTDRNEAMLLARHSGLSLERIGAEFGITRERVRQCCNLVVYTRALSEIVSEAAQ